MLARFIEEERKSILTPLLRYRFRAVEKQFRAILAKIKAETTRREK